MIMTRRRRRTRTHRAIGALPMPLALLALLVASSNPAIAGGPPPRPGPGEGSNFTVHAGPEWVHLDLDPRGARALVAAGLDPRIDGTGLMLGVGWTFARPLRLDLSVGGVAGEVDRPGVGCGLARAVADLHLALVENRHAALEATASLGGLVLFYTEAMDGEGIPAGEVGLGLTARVAVAGPVSLAVGYRWQQALFARAELELAGGGEEAEEVAGPVAVHPTARFHGIRLMLRIDL